MKLLGDWRKKIEYMIATIRAKSKFKSGEAYHSNGATKKKCDIALVRGRAKK